MPPQRLSPAPPPFQPRHSIPPHPFGADVRCVPCKVLRNAIRAVLLSWGKRPRSTGQDEVSDLAGLVASAIHQAYYATGVDVSVQPKPDRRIHSSLGRRLLELLRNETVDGWREVGLPDTELLPLFSAMEHVRITIQPDWAQTFAQQLSGSNGVALLMDVAHDLRSPLTSILVLAETLQRGQTGAVNQGQHRQLGLIYTAALGLSSVASDLIEFAQGGDQLVEQGPTPFSVTGILKSVHDIVRPIAEAKRLSIKLVVPPTNDQRLGHAVALSRVLLNLTTNALKFTDVGTVELGAEELGGAAPPERIRFSVRDNGHGIPPEKLMTLFQPLRKEVGRRGQLFSQSGLGLAICRQLVSAMKSELQVESRVGEGAGTRFFFDLDLPIVPVRRSGARAAPRISGEQAARTSGPHGQRNSGSQRRP